MAREVRVAVVGAGSAAQVVHLPILRRLPDVAIAGIVDPQVRKARSIAERFGVPRVATELSGLGPDGIDAVLVCVPNREHEEIVLEALERGAHVLCERPLAVSEESAARMVAAARAAERQLMVAMNQRFRYDVRTIRHFVAAGDLGRVFYVRSTALNRRERRPRRGWRRDPEASGGGALMDLGAQALDVALWTLGFPAVTSVTTRTHGDDAVESSAIVLAGLETGASLCVEVTWELLEERDRHVLYVLGTHGSARSSPFRVQRGSERGLLDVTPPLERPAAGTYTESYRQEWAEFLRFVRGEKALEPAEDQVRLHRVLEACYRSAREEREVTV